MVKEIVKLIFSLFFIGGMELNAQVITNVTALQDQNNIMVSYQLATNDSCTIELYVSDSLDNWVGPMVYVSGDVGENVKSGVKTLIWSGVLLEFGEISGYTVRFKVLAKKNMPQIGEYFQGGIVFYIDGDHGLISLQMGLGAMSWFDAQKACSNLYLNGFSDWYLPSKEELEWMYLYKVRIGNFLDNYYWSSSESSYASAWAFSFNSGKKIDSDKSLLGYVRPIRAFKIK